MILAKPPTSGVPLLENGDRLTRIQFEQRYHVMPDLKKAELIEGRVYMASPVRATKHGKPHAMIMTWLGNYWSATPGIELLDNATVRIDEDNEPQPDACLRMEEQRGGNSRISEDDYVEGAPELIVEIAASTASYDLHEKKQVYRRSGVQEYIVWRVNDGVLDWFELKDGVYVDLPLETDGSIHSCVFPGLWLPMNELLAGDLAAVLTGLQLGLASPEYWLFRTA
jgi:Uma2 family endonuclease